MRKRGVIYKSNFSSTSGVTSIHVPIYLRLVGMVATVGGSMSLSLMMVFYGGLLERDMNVKFDRKWEVEEVAAEEIEDKKEEVVKPELRLEKRLEDEVVSIEIPVINAKSEVVLDVDPFDRDSYMEALRKGVAHVKGTYLPGEGKTIYLFSHSTDSPFNIVNYNAVFYSLKDLVEGDEIIVNKGDKTYIYSVTEKIKVGAKDTSWLEVKNQEQLILQTCDPPGTRWMRLLIIAEPK